MSARITSLHSLFVDQLREMFAGESNLVVPLSELGETIRTPEVRKVIFHHLDETKMQLSRVEHILVELGEDPRGNPNLAIQGLVAEMHNLAQGIDDPDLREEAIISALLKVEHYEASSYRSLLQISKQLEFSQYQSILEESLAEEEKAISALQDLQDWRKTYRVVNQPMDSEIQAPPVAPSA